MNLDGDMEWSWVGSIGIDSLLHVFSEDLFVENDHIVAVHTGNDGSANTDRSFVFLQQLSLNGQSQWLKKYDLGIDFPDALAKEVISVPDGFMIYGHRAGGTGLFFIKTDKNGTLQWARKFETGGSLLDDDGLTQSQLIWMHDGAYFAAKHQNATGQTDMIFGKICSNGELGIDCPFLTDLQVIQSEIGNPATQPVALSKQEGGQSTIGSPNQPWNLVTSLTPNTLCFANNPPCDTIRKFETIQFCPGDTVWIASNAYISPGLVLDTIPGVASCDTIISYKLLFYEPEAGALSISCPNNISVIAGPGQAPVPIQYPLPTALSDCSCPGIAINLDSGLSPGSLFPNGVTQVCYSAADPCGNTASCCFSVQVREEQACDIKIAGCIKYELLNITSDPDQNLTIKIRVTNNCPNPLDYTAIQLPAGVVAEAPLNNSIFLTENGHEYQVRNPNFSPVYSIRFKTNEPTGISGGQSDVFTYTLPGQSGKPNYVYVVSKLEPQSYYETHLNTFNCPVLSGNKQTVDRSVTVQRQQSLKVVPNPTSGRIQLDLGAMEGGQLLKMYNNQGKLVWETEVVTGGIATVELPEILVNGLYLITVGIESTRMMLQR
ncbi:MAG: HYR domain-containing protein, partial [Saprospiraceae bacterium]|nr:HYR domain-containing protein [Saprospiraceae bacterium]